jgi:hypothetical protein
MRIGASLVTRKLRGGGRVDGRRETVDDGR